MKKNNQKIELLNSEGPILIAKNNNNNSYDLLDGKKNLIETLSTEEFINFLYNDREIILNGKKINYKDFSSSMKPEKEDLEIFIKGIQTFIPFNAQDGQWISPVNEEREWQEDVLKELFPSYPNGAPRWQYLNGLLQIALRYKEQMEIDREDSEEDDESEDDENG